MQIIQFICSFFVTIPFLHFGLKRGYHSWSCVIFSTAVNFSFLLLFINFYINSYKSTKKSTTSKKLFESPQKNATEDLKKTKTPKAKKVEELLGDATASPVRRSPRKKPSVTYDFSSK
jgi:hypothetical protein